MNAAEFLNQDPSRTSTDESSVSDLALLKRFIASRDESAFAELVSRYSELVLGVCRRVLTVQQDVEDAFQAVFLVLAGDAGKIRKRRSIASWLYGVAHRIALRALARRYRRREEALGEDVMGQTNPLAELASRHEQEAVDDELNQLPEKYREAGMALGFSRPSQIRRIILPQCFYGMVTGVLLGLARAAGETAAIMFTATTFSGIQLPQSFSDPVPTLQTHILVLAQEATNPDSVAQAWGAGLVLLGLVFILTLTAWAFRTRMVMESEQ